MVAHEFRLMLEQELPRPPSVLRNHLDMSRRDSS